LVPVAVRNATAGGIDVEAAISGFFALGIGVGSLLAAQLARGRITLGWVPTAALGMAVFLCALSWTTHGIALIGHAEMSLTDFFASARGLAIAAEVFGLSTSGGLFVVPLFAAIQARAAPERRARTVAAVNIQNSVFMVAGSLAASLLQSRFLDLGEATLLGLLGLCNVGAAAYAHRAVAGAVGKAV
jgi:acyl-[acyl-carrier-protein]-phospholipid O-acyltransferase/long-chain-fatty-acid--[acyl-carrier-protein] ligase